MNWGRTIAYLGTHAGAAFALMGAGYQLAEGSAFWFLLNVLAAWLFWLIWKWTEER